MHTVPEHFQCRPPANPSPVSLLQITHRWGKGRRETAWNPKHLQGNDDRKPMSSPKRKSSACYPRPCFLQFLPSCPQPYNYQEWFQLHECIDSHLPQKWVNILLGNCLLACSLSQESFQSPEVKKRTVADQKPPCCCCLTRGGLSPKRSMHRCE